MNLRRLRLGVCVLGLVAAYTLSEAPPAHRYDGRAIDIGPAVVSQILPNNEPSPGYFNQISNSLGISEGLQEQAITEVFGNCGSPCRVTSNSGGYIYLYARAAIGFLSGRHQGLVIDGPCVSACALAADYAREAACITKRAAFGFHRTNSGVPPPHNDDIAAWVEMHGGFPANDTQRVTWMGYRQALSFWRTCE